METKKKATIGVSRNLYDSVKKFITERSELGYNSPSEFIRDAIRNKLKNYET